MRPNQSRDCHWNPEYTEKKSDLRANPTVIICAGYNDVSRADHWIHFSTFLQTEPCPELLGGLAKNLVFGTFIVSVAYIFIKFLQSHDLSSHTVPPECQSNICDTFVDNMEETTTNNCVFKILICL